MKVLVTGAAGFIGYHVAARLIARGDEVIGVDNFNPYYDPALKEARAGLLQDIAAPPGGGFAMVRIDLARRAAVDNLFASHAFDRVIHLAAQPGVRHSLTHPHDYVEANVTGFINVLDACRRHGVGHLVYASTSSVYGANTTLPLSEHHGVDHPLQLYAATKRANELMAHAYSHLYRLPTTGLRFFTVYGPWGRPDMAPMLFADAILAGRAIDVFNHGHHARDFTYIDDIVEGVVRVCDKPATASSAFDPARPDPATSKAPFRLFNIGNSKPVALNDFIAALERSLGRKAERNLKPMQPGDVAETWADMSELADWVGYRPDTDLDSGVARFVAWFTQWRRRQAPAKS